MIVIVLFWKNGGLSARAGSAFNPQAVQVRLLNLRLVLSNQDQTGYELVPVARVEKSARADAPPAIDTTYIPPVLAWDSAVRAAL